MHIEVEQLNLLFAGKLDAAERTQLTAHILDCSACTNRFKALHALHEESTHLRANATPKRKAIPLRYIIGVAAVMFMAITPYFTRHAPEKPIPEALLVQQNPAFDIRAEVGKVNYQSALQSWGQEKSLQDLVRLNDVIQ